MRSKVSKLLTTTVAKWTAIAAILAISTPNIEASDALKMGFVNFRKSIEESKVGKQQQTSFESLQNQMESSLMEMQKNLNELSTKLNDQDYMDGLAPAAENELKHKYRTLSQELARTQNQYVQTLQDANLKIIQQISAEITDSAKEVAKSKQLDLILNEEVAFFYKSSLDVTKDVIAQMDHKFEKENRGQQEQKESAKER